MPIEGILVYKNLIIKLPPRLISTRTCRSFQFKKIVAHGFLSLTHARASDLQTYCIHFISTTFIHLVVNNNLNFSLCCLSSPFIGRVRRDNCRLQVSISWDWIYTNKKDGCKVTHTLKRAILKPLLYYEMSSNNNWLNKSLNFIQA